MAIKPAITPREKRRMDSSRASLSLKNVNINSSSMKGAHSAEANGHPKTPATANQKMPWEVLKPPRQFMNAAPPTMTAYMAKLEGRYAALAWKFPGVATVASRKRKPMRPLRVRTTAW